MNYRIICDSASDLTEGLRKQMKAIIAPMTITIDEEEHIDDETLNISTFMKTLKESKNAARTAAPPPDAYGRNYDQADQTYVVTISNKLSSSFSNAMIAKDSAEKPERIHVFDSLSAAAGQTLAVIKLHQLLENKTSSCEINKILPTFIKNIKTYFVLEDLTTFEKQGRLGSVANKLINVLHVRPIMGSDGNGSVSFYSYARGKNKIKEKLLSFIESSGKNTNGETAVISHCNNKGMAEWLKESIKSRFSFSNIHIVPTRGVTSLYANEGGIVLAF